MTYAKKTVKIGARGSKLSLAQVETIKAALKAAWPEAQFETKIIKTAGDKDQKTPLPEIGGKGLFTAELEEALQTGKIDLAVHCQKDLPIQDAKGLCLGAIFKRDAVEDAFISHQKYQLETLPKNAKIGTSSTRRKAQLLVMRPDLEVLSIRGNVDTRLKKAGNLDGIILAYAGLERLGLDASLRWHDKIKRISKDVMLPAPAQGALAIQCRQEQDWLDFLKPIHDSQTADCTLAERSFLEGLGGGCSLPISALATCQNGLIKLEGQVLNPDGSKQIRESITGENPRELGLELARRCIKKGANELIGG